MFWIGLIVDLDLLSLSLSLHVEHLVSLDHGGLGGGEGGVSSVLLSTASSSDSSLGYSYAEVFLDSACFFSMMMMVQVIVELLELGTCSHLFSLLLDVLEGGGGVVSSVLLSTASSSVQSLLMTPCNLVVDLETVGPGVDSELGLGVLLRLGGLHNLVLLGSLHVNVVLDKVDSWRQSRRLCPRLKLVFFLISLQSA